MIWQLVDSSGIGGIESHITNLTLALNAAGYPAKIVLLKEYSNPWLKQLDHAKLSWQALDGSLSNLVKALKSERPVLLHTHGYKAGILGRMAAKVLNIPVVSTFHAGERGAFPVSLYQTLDEWSSFLGGRIAVNDIIAQKMPFKTVPVRNFILPDTQDPLTIKPLSVGFVGRLSHEKGPDIFCKIANMINKNIPFHVFGDGPLRTELETEYGRRVTFHGVATNMKRVWPRIGLLLMPSRAEGLPMAALEALSHGIPVLASEAGSFRNIILESKTGWIKNCDDISGMASAIEHWISLDTQTHIKMSQNCIADVTKRYGSDEPVAQILAIYREAGY